MNNPVTVDDDFSDGFDGWQDTPQTDNWDSVESSSSMQTDQQEDDWGLPQSSSSSQLESKADWGSLETGKLDDWDSGSSSQSSNASDWDNTSYANADWGGQVEQEVTNSQPVQDIQQSISRPPKKPFNFSMKTAGIIIAVLFLLIALFLMMLDSIKIKPKQQAQPKTSTQSTQQTASQPSSNNESFEGGISLVEIPESTTLDYTTGLLEATGTVVRKVKYLEDHQVIYCIIIRIAAGSASEDIRHYCNYDSYAGVEVGDLIQVTYQQVQEGYISLNKVIKN